jgi:heme exporter protein B
MRLLNVCLDIIYRDLLLAYRQSADIINPLLFFVLVIVLFPLAISPDSHLLHTIAPGLLWVAALLATLLSLDRLFRADYEDGTLNLLLLSPYPLSVLVLAKVVGHWLVTALPLIIISPLLGLSLHLSLHEIGILVLTLLLGTPTLSLIGAIGSALTVGLKHNSMLLSLLVLPLYIPVLIFGAGAVVNVSSQLNINGQLALLLALLVLAFTLAPVAIAAALRIGAD